MYILSTKLCAFQAIAARIHSCLFLINYPCNSHQRLLISWVSLMQMMLIWAFMIIHSSFINEVFTTARLRGCWRRNWRCSLWQAHRGSFDYLCLMVTCAWEQGHSWLLHLLPQIAELTTYCRWELNLFCVCFIWWARTRESSLTCSQFPSKAQGCAGAVPCSR